MIRVRPSATAVALFLLMGLVRPATAQQGGPITIAGLGTITFPTSTASAVAESTFVRGVLLLHLFHYDEAADAFRQAQRLDPTMAMAYWGEAMTHTHGVWNQQAIGEARDALAKYAPTAAAREARAPTPRERGYLRAVDILYGDGPKARRDTLYNEAMAALSRAYPADDEARAFHALAMLSLSQGVRNVPTYLRAAAVAESVFARNPNHPGAAHYWIHGMDDPEHAADALLAARALSGIAPDAGHAQHMTSHIFMALGMWDDVVRANENAMRVVNTARAANGRPAAFCGHYNFWLEYGQLQLARVDSARTLLKGCIAQAAPTAGDPNSTDPDNSALGSALGMWARYLIDTEAWSDPLASWSPAIGGDPIRATWNFGRGFAAIRRGDLATARTALAEFQATRARLERRFAGSGEAEDVEYLKALAIFDLQLRAELLLAEAPARRDSAVALLRQSTAIEDDMAYAFGPPVVIKPAHEELGEVLLRLGRRAAARPEFEAALTLTPNRVAAVRGLAKTKTGQ